MEGLIDTVSGLVFDLRSNKKISAATIGLFKNNLTENFDSLVRGHSSNYFVFSNKEGEYSFSNLKKGNYTLFALKDLNLNNKYEEPELISMPITISVGKDTVINIPIFTEDVFLKKDTLFCLPKQTNSDSLEYGSVNLNFKRDIYGSGGYFGELLLQDSTIFCFKINSKTIKIDSLSVGSYSFRMFNDTNNNNLWNSGDIKNLTPPENIKFYSEKIDIKKDWEIDVVID